jgi:hypothetical protein
MSKHTPVWRVESWRGKYWMVVDAERGLIIAEKIGNEAHARLIAAAPELLMLAEKIGNEPNASLIAAAPELLEAARFIEQLLTALVRTDCDDEEERDAVGEALLQIRGAIAKAEGK